MILVMNTILKDVTTRQIKNDHTQILINIHFIRKALSPFFFCMVAETKRKKKIK